MDHARVFEKLTQGQFLLMPSEVGPQAGCLFRCHSDCTSVET
ncbi:Ornithine cyclodeaminase [Leifsonia rubra CMS 76R]|nr:Ornithine cyclodeaminase [Leifsonia rubra CMS 76R]